MPNSPPPPTYEEAVQCSLETPPKQKRRIRHPSKESHSSLASQSTDNITRTSLKLVHSSPSLITSNPSRSLAQKEISATPSALNLSVPSIHPDSSKRCDDLSSSDTPAIIIHSVVSTPGENEQRCYTKREDIPTNQLQEQYTEPSNHANRFCDNARVHGQFSTMDIEMAPLQTFHKFEKEVDLTYDNITSDNSSILQPTAPSESELCKPFVEFRQVSSHDIDVVSELRNVITNVAYRDSNGVAFGNKYCAPKGISTGPQFQSHDPLIRKPQFQGLVRSNDKSNSMDEAWCEPSAAERLRMYDLSQPQIIIRERSGTLDETTLSTKHSFKQGCNHDNTTLTTPTSSKISQSYSDLSNRHHAGCTQDTYCDRGICKCLHYQSSTVHDHRLVVIPNVHKHNNTCSHFHHAGDSRRISKHHLLPDTRELQGSRGMRSVSVDDVRMRSGLDEYVWRDGKVQLKNGGISHGESVRYVWKDGHVEKITTDANNSILSHVFFWGYIHMYDDLDTYDSMETLNFRDYEETQVEILETVDSKTCSRINPVFVCVFLLAVIAVVIILPVYFSR